MFHTVDSLNQGSNPPVPTYKGHLSFMTHPTLKPFEQPVSVGTGPPEYDRKLVEPWAYSWVYKGTLHHIEIPASTEQHDVVYDPSIPYMAQFILPDDPFEAASLPHDVLYKLQGKTEGVVWVWSENLRRWLPRRHVSREFADDLFDHLLREQEVTAWRRRLAMWAIRVGGWAAWIEEDDFTLP